MKKTINSVIVGIVLVLVLVGLAWFAQYEANRFGYGNKPSSTEQQTTYTPCPSSHTAEGRGFSISCPDTYSFLTNTVQNQSGETIDSLSFVDASGGPWIFAVEVTDTTEQSTDSWLSKQTKGNQLTGGINFLQWQNAGDKRFAVYINYVQVDTNEDGSPIYGPYIQASMVATNRLYTAIGRSDDYNNLAPTKFFLDTLSTFRLT